MGYKEQRGVVGQYRGADVYVITYKKLTEDMTKSSDTIFAVVSDAKHQNDKMELVQRGICIGTMTDSGRVELWDNGRRRNYKCYKEPEPVQKTATPEWSVSDAPAAELGAPLNVEFGYGAYSKVVDNFFKGLDKLWAEIDASIDT